METSENLLIVITGATASGKTSLAIELAQSLATEIISADSRQLFRGMTIGTAAPTAQELAAVRHHFVQDLELTDYFSAAMFEEQAMQRLPEIFARGGGRAVVAGGSMMYIDALCNGIDRLPTVSEANRTAAYDLYRRGGLAAVTEALERLDPEYLQKTPDLKNHKRLIHALEISMEAGRPYSSMLSGEKKQRPFRVMKFIIDHPRDVLFDRINRRVERMISDGLVEEARALYPYRHLNALNTVGYKELFVYLDGVWDLPTAIARIQKNTRVYAKKQLTWLRRDPEVIPLDPSLPLLHQVISRI